MYYVTLAASCEYTPDSEVSNQNFEFIFGFQDEAHFETCDDTGFDDLIGLFNQHLPLGWQVDDAIEVVEFHGAGTSSAEKIIEVK